MERSAANPDFALAQFQRLMKDLRAGNWQRTSFAPWEMELLLDIAACEKDVASRRDLLNRYQKAVERRLANHCEMPMKLSEYVAGLQARHSSRPIASVDETEPHCASALS